MISQAAQKIIEYSYSYGNLTIQICIVHIKLFQLCGKKKEIFQKLLDQFQVTANLVRRAENTGFCAIVLTVDAQYSGRRLADIKNKFKLPSHLKMANFVGLELDDTETQ